MVNTSFTLKRKLPLSPYSMFSVFTPRGGYDGIEDFPLLAQYRLIRTVVIGDDLIGMRGGDIDGGAYNPFDLYGAAQCARRKALPPHLVFARLEKEVAGDACAFLDAYGPLERTNDYDSLSELELKEWKKASRISIPPEKHFRDTFGEVPLLPDRPTPRDFFDRYPVKQFWDAQSDFELALRLHGALNSPTDRGRNIQRILLDKDVQWNLKGPNVERLYIKRAWEFVTNKVNSNLIAMTPRLFKDLNSTTVSAAWPCYSLLEAMYLMLFLDIAGRGARIAQCEKCMTIFYTALDRGKYCSSECENRARALRAYHRKQKKRSSRSPARKKAARKSTADRRR